MWFAGVVSLGRCLSSLKNKRLGSDTRCCYLRPGIASIRPSPFTSVSGLPGSRGLGAMLTTRLVSASQSRWKVRAEEPGAESQGERCFHPRENDIFFMPPFTFHLSPFTVAPLLQPHHTPTPRLSLPRLPDPKRIPFNPSH